MSLCVYDNGIGTRLPDYIHLKGHEYSKEGNHDHAIAAFSWAIAFNINNSHNSQSYNLSDRADEYYRKNNHEQAMEDYSRAISINPKIIPLLWHSTNWSLFLGVKPGIKSYPVYKDIFRAIISGGVKKAIFFARRGMDCAVCNDKHGILRNFLYAIDKDLFLAKNFKRPGKTIYREALIEIKKALCVDLCLPLEMLKDYLKFELEVQNQYLKVTSTDNFPIIVNRLLENLRYNTIEQASAFSERGFLFLEKYEREKYFNQEKKKDLKTAIYNFNEAIRIDPSTPGFYINRAVAYDFLNDPEMAIIDIEKAIEMEYPPDRIKLINLGIFYAMKGDWYQAFDIFKRAKNLGVSQTSSIDEEADIIELLKKKYLDNLKKICNDDFYIILKQFIERNGIDVMDKKNLYALLSDFLKNEYKIDFLLFYCLVEKRFHKVILETCELEETRRNILIDFSGSSEYKKDDINRMIDIIYCLGGNNENLE